MRRIPDVLLCAAYFVVVTGCLLAALAHARARAREAHVERIVRAAESHVTVAADSRSDLSDQPEDALSSRGGRSGRRLRIRRLEG